MARHQKVMAHYLKCDLLIIDDMGIKQPPPKSGEYLFVPSPKGDINQS